MTVSHYSCKLKFQVVLESFDRSKTPGQIAKAYRGHPNSIGSWKKIFLKLEKCWDLPLLWRTHHPQPSGIRQVIASAGAGIDRIATLTTIGCLQVRQTDFTDLVYANGPAKAHLIPLLDHTSKVVLGWALGERALTELALDAWKQAKETFAAMHVTGQGVIVQHGQDGVFTSYRWTSQLLLDATTLNELRTGVAARMHDYNRERRHSSLKYVAPMTYLKQYLRSRSGTPNIKP